MIVKKVVILGGGVLGSQIAYQSAFSGIKTVIYDISDEAVQQAQQKIDSYPQQYKQDIGATDEQVQAANANLSLTTDMKAAATDADVIIEAVPERLDIKESTYKSLAPYITDQTLLLTNSSTLIPSQLIDFAPNKKRFMAMHFANLIWTHNVAELMWAKDTPQATIDDAEAFAKQIHMIPILIHKEISGYIMNSIFLPMINAALKLWANGYSDPLSIDKNWMVSMGVDRGPFGFLDIMGLNTAVNIEMGFYQNTHDEDYKKIADKLTEYVQDNKLGVASGEGFYHYPNPAYQDPAFLKA
ncbi:3-hydroxyacyl-CoA dehydrogenase [Lentilactobacillus parabuchneri]|uniref:3-hydroxyacyl-CoA dehydrogenase n=5 Tax=Lentilactobacillus parabuchneri TaxID=152331 RepID=A0A1X1FCW9_9LACO|nr:3-hydroxyacyl-CoA dehydrogenase [Lentilactobacillus parabuchneri]APR08095.1 putative 3-hydroxybutyryl-CoA dehydrogenase [Lentilactobacillus parabuchneri]KRM46610.1 3-hydroxybutyryl-CoA dehydrogenase [Lentilactobacillus parabuchneri DSM 5707 = NBRC 107865]KRN76485.1 3-hydroxybutyryl-CoA dehydrogenase [Lentilactobacillus parabuchneri]MBW0222351.1 3-hydroxyacyl-CoA dehydrogenase [Lentilactobacillus parabuchneri]MBW0244536.1 3-hydroxyacyl-CoA dehydrogenase [Lentilactobacillus parabuchneri]